LSAEKSLDILDLYNAEIRELSVAQIAERLHQPQSSVYRHLRLLKEKGFVIESGVGLYRLGYRFLDLAKIVKMDNSISTIALPSMRRLTQETGETSILTILSGLHVVCLETVSSIQPIKVSAEQGQIMALYGGASSKPLLAYLPDETLVELFEQQIVKRHTANTIVDLEQMRENLREIRNSGYAKSDGELDEGVYAYGAPVWNMDDKVVASLSIAGPRDRMLEKDEGFLVQSIQSAVKEIQKYL
jgi:DNA-binding IclR family transcriptional regulator